MAGSSGPRVGIVSIGAKLALGIVALIALLCAGVYVALTAQERASLLSARRESAAMVMDLLVEALRAPVVFADDVGVQETLDFLHRNRDVTDAAVWRVEASRVGPRLGSLRQRGAQAALRTPTPERLDEVVLSSDALEISRAVHDLSGQLIAVASVRFSLERERATFALLSRRILQVSVASALAVIALLLVLARIHIVGPLRTLSRAARELTAGREAELPTAGRDEIAELGRALSKMVRALAGRERAIAEKSAAMQRILDNVGQGFLVVAPDGRIIGQHSAVVTHWFGPLHGGETLWGYLRPYDREAAEWIELVWGNLGQDGMPVELCMEQLPKHFRDPSGHDYECAFRPIFGGEGQLEAVVLVVSDVTELEAGVRAEREQREIAAVLNRIIVDRVGFRSFFEDANERVRRIVGSQGAPLAPILRDLHTVKGNASLYKMQSVSELCAAIEQSAAETGAIASEQRDALAAAWMKIAIVVDQVLGEESHGALELSSAELSALFAAIDRYEPHEALAARLRALQGEPARRVLMRLAERITLLARRLGKGEVQVEVRDGGLRVAPDRFAPLAAALLHVAHNAIDHGIEPPAERERLGKPVPARIVLALEQQGEQLVIRVADDGSGVDWAKVRERACAFG